MVRESDILCGIIHDGDLVIMFPYLYFFLKRLYLLCSQFIFRSVLKFSFLRFGFICTESILVQRFFSVIFLDRFLLFIKALRLILCGLILDTFRTFIVIGRSFIRHFCLINSSVPLNRRFFSRVLPICYILFNSHCLRRSCLRCHCRNRSNAARCHNNSQ